MTKKVFNPAARKLIYILFVIICIILLIYKSNALTKIESESTKNLAQKHSQNEMNLERMINKNEDAYSLAQIGQMLTPQNPKIAVLSLKRASEKYPNWRDCEWLLANAYLAWANTFAGENKSQDEMDQFKITLDLAKSQAQKVLSLDPTFEPAKDMLASIK